MLTHILSTNLRRDLAHHRHDRNKIEAWTRLFTATHEPAAAAVMSEPERHIRIAITCTAIQLRGAISELQEAGFLA